jgi:hypothetical protein
MANSNDETERLERLRLIEERKNGIACTLVCDDGLSGGKVFELRCVRPWGCIEAGGCFTNCDAGLEN